MTFVMLAMERLSCAFSPQMTWPDCGSKMMAAAARMSGTRAPDASVLNRGVMASLTTRMARSRDCSRALAEARALARRALRALDELAEYTLLVVVFLTVVDDCFARAAAWAGTGKTAARPTISAQTWANFIGRIRRTNPPSRPAGWGQPC